VITDLICCIFKLCLFIFRVFCTKLKKVALK